jgi:hypothetical protein
MSCGHQSFNKVGEEQLGLKGRGSLSLTAPMSGFRVRTIKFLSVKL